MANEISKSNLVVAGVIAFFGCPALCTGVATTVAKPLVAVTSPLVCPEGTRLDSEYVNRSDFRGHRTDVEAHCVDAAGRAQGGDVYPKSFAVLYGVALVLWAGLLAWFFRPGARGENDRDGGARGTPPGDGPTSA